VHFDSNGLSNAAGPAVGIGAFLSAFRIGCSFFRIIEGLDKTYYAPQSRPLLVRTSGFLDCGILVV
jgi:hypothetical protein